LVAWLDGSEKTAFDKVKDKASDLGHKAADKPVELKNQAAKENKRHEQGRADQSSKG
jgi:hypothetical protein